MKLITLNSRLSSLIARSVANWGEEAQMNMAVEEASELIQAIMKLKRLDVGDPNIDADKAISNVKEEIADTLLMLLQLTFKVFDPDEIEEWMNIKLDRLHRRLNAYESMFNEKP